jgi:hypothetical protein
MRIIRRNDFWLRTRLFSLRIWSFVYHARYASL